MPPLNPISYWDERGVDGNRPIVAKYFFVCEGSNTEKWYFNRLFSHLNKLPNPVMIDLRYVDRTEDHATSSHPSKLGLFAEEIRNDKEGKYGFDKDLDTTVVVFDADIFKSAPNDYKNLIHDLSADNIVGVTQPSIELYLLLHQKGAYQKFIVPYSDELFANKKVNKNRRFVEKHFSDHYGINPKTNACVGDLALDFLYAIQEEKHLNNDIDSACSELTSNIGHIIEEILSK